MSYNKIRRSFSLIYILFILLIITRILQYSNDQRKHVNNNDYVVKLFIKDYPNNCWYTAMGLVFQLENCRQYPLASELTITGRRTQLNANPTDRSIFIDVNDVFVYKHNKSKISQAINRTQQILFGLRIDIFSSISKILPEPLSGLFLSLNFGGTSHLDTETKQIISQIGIQHLVAASGMQVSILMMILSHLLKNLSKVNKLFIIICLIIIYLHLALLSVSILRAGIMCFLYLVAGAWHKINNKTLLLSQAALGILYVRPDMFFEISFQLSFMATFGILFTQKYLGMSNNQIAQLETGTLITYVDASIIEKSSILEVIKSYVKETLHVSLVVNLWLWPILLYHFSEINLLGLVSGLTLIWLLSPIFIFGLVLVVMLMLLSIFDMPDLLLTIIASPSYWLMRLFVAIFEQLSKLDILIIKFDQFSPLLIGGWYVSLFIFFYLIKLIKKKRYEAISVDF